MDIERSPKSSKFGKKSSESSISPNMRFARSSVILSHSQRNRKNWTNFSSPFGQGSAIQRHSRLKEDVSAKNKKNIIASHRASMLVNNEDSLKNNEQK
jgi:hypothetical protein